MSKHASIACRQQANFVGTAGKGEEYLRRKIGSLRREKYKKKKNKRGKRKKKNEKAYKSIAAYKDRAAYKQAGLPSKAELLLKAELPTKTKLLTKPPLSTKGSFCNNLKGSLVVCSVLIGKMLYGSFTYKKDNDIHLVQHFDYH